MRPFYHFCKRLVVGCDPSAPLLDRRVPVEVIHMLLQRLPTLLPPHRGAHRIDQDRVCGALCTRQGTLRRGPLRSALGGTLVVWPLVIRPSTCGRRHVAVDALHLVLPRRTALLPPWPLIC